MVITGTTLVSLVILVVALVLMPGAQAWWLRLIWFFLSLGAAITLMLGFGISAGPAALMSAAIFGIMAIASLRRLKGGKGVSIGNLVCGVIFAVMTAALLFQAFNLFQFQMPGTIWDSIVHAFQTGVGNFFTHFKSLFGGT